MTTKKPRAPRPGRSWINPLPPSEGRITRPFTPDNARRFVAHANGKAHLLAYLVDRNPGHIFDAVYEYLKLQVRLPDWMLKNLRDGIMERLKKPAGNPRRYTLRDVYVLQAVVTRYNGKIPTQVDARLVANLARSHNTTAAAIKMSLTRWRQYQRSRPRAS